MTKDTNLESDIDFLLKKNAALEARLERLEARPAPKPEPYDPNSDLPKGQYRDFSGSIRYEATGQYVPDAVLLATGAEMKANAQADTGFDPNAGLPKGQRRLPTGQVIGANGQPVAVAERNEQALKDAFSRQRPEGRG